MKVGLVAGEASGDVLGAGLITAIRQRAPGVQFAGVAGPAFFWLASLLTGSSRAGLLSVLVFFAVGGLLLLRVDVAAGRRAARAAEPGSDQAG